MPLETEVQLHELSGQTLADAIKRFLVNKFNKARRDHPDWIPDLTGADLSQANIPGINLQNATLFSVNFRATNLQRADLSHANLLKADCRGANLRDSDLQHADIDNFDEEDMAADFREAIICGVTISACQVEMFLAVSGIEVVEED